MITKNKIYCMDCMKGLRNVPNHSVDLIIIDPPYTSPVITAIGRKKIKNVADLSIQEHYMDTLKKEFERILKPKAPVFIFCDDKYYPSIWHSLQLVIWDKGKIGLGKPFRKQHELILYANRDSFEYYRTGMIYSTIMKYKPINVTKRLHPAEKPLKLVKDLVKGFSKEGDVVLDCFMGAGTTAVACKQLNRNFIGFELNPDYIEIANNQLNQTILK